MRSVFPLLVLVHWLIGQGARLPRERRGFEFRLDHLCLQCFDAVGRAARRASDLYKLSGGILTCYLSGARCK